MPTDNQISEDVLIARIGQLVEAIRSDGSPEELERIKKLIRRNVPFTLRGYFSAYLLRELMKTPQARDGRRERRDVRAERQERKPREVRPERRRPGRSRSSTGGCPPGRGGEGWPEG